jgi:predicted esterase
MAMMESNFSNTMLLKYTVSVVFVLLFACSFSSTTDMQVLGKNVLPLRSYSTYSRFPHGNFKSSSLTMWRKFVPGIQVIHIKSSADGTMQPSLFYDSGSKVRRPLLVVLHSWSNNYLQNISIPYAEWAEQNDWIFIHPDSRGIYDSPASTASEKAVSDILDAVDWAKRNANVDESRIYLTGYSGGAMTSLVMAGRYPDLWTAVSAWVPIYDLCHWYEYTNSFPERYYGRHIRQSVGGEPIAGNGAWEEAKKRSPVSYLPNAAGKNVKVYIASGIDDDNVPVDHALMAFNDLSDSTDKFLYEEIEYMRANRSIPPHLVSEIEDPEFTSVGLPLVLERESGNVVIKLFKGGHDVIYNAGLIWLSGQSKSK